MLTKKYEIITADTVTELVDKVNAAINVGYEPTGGFFYDHTEDLYYQAMIKE